ncbi:GIP [Symbiodinium sp. CCMP2592]|nr:GIP [Symbiodinium sp. CCMP2592]
MATVGEAVVALPPQIIHLREFKDEARECGRLTDRALSIAKQQLHLGSLLNVPFSEQASSGSELIHAHFGPSGSEEKFLGAPELGVVTLRQLHLQQWRWRTMVEHLGQRVCQPDRPWKRESPDRARRRPPRVPLREPCISSAEKVILAVGTRSSIPRRASLPDERNNGFWSVTRISEVLHRRLVAPLLEHVQGPERGPQASPTWRSPTSAQATEPPLMSPETRRAMAEWTAQQTSLTTSVPEPPPMRDDSSAGSMSRELVMEDVRRQVQIAMRTRDAELQALNEQNTELQGALWVDLKALKLEAFRREKLKVQVLSRELHPVYPDLHPYLAAIHKIGDVVKHNPWAVLVGCQEMTAETMGSLDGSRSRWGDVPKEKDGLSPLDVLVRGMKQLQDVYLEKKTPEFEALKNNVELPQLPDPIGEMGVEFSDWLYVAEQIIGSLSDSSTRWFADTLKCAKEAYAKHQLATPMERLSISPTIPPELAEARWSRLERKVMTMLLTAMPQAIKEDPVTHRVGTVAGILYRLHVLYAPGGSAERSAILKQLEGTAGGENITEVLAQLRRWRRTLSRALEMQVSPPDACVLLKGVELITGAAVRKQCDVQFRLALARNELQLQNRPTQETVLKYFDHVLSELQQSAPSRQSTRTGHSTEEHPRLRAVDGQAGTGGTAARTPPSSPEKGDDGAGNHSSASTTLSSSATSTGDTVVQAEPIQAFSPEALQNPELQTFMKEVNVMLQRMARLSALQVADVEAVESLHDEVALKSVEMESSWALLDSGATHPFRPAQGGEDTKAPPVSVKLADGKTVMLHQNRAGTLMPCGNSSNNQSSSNSSFTTIVPLGSLVKELGCTVSWTKRGLQVEHPEHGTISTHVVGSCPYIGESQALELIRELENRKLEQLKVNTIETQLRMNGLEAQLSFGAQLQEYRRTGNRADGLKALMCEDSAFGVLTEQQRCTLIQDIDLSDKAGHQYLKATLLNIDLSISKAFNLREPSPAYRALLWAATRGQVHGVLGGPPRNEGVGDLVLKQMFLWAVARSAAENYEIVAAWSPSVTVATSLDLKMPVNDYEVQSSTGALEWTKEFKEKTSTGGFNMFELAMYLTTHVTQLQSIHQTTYDKVTQLQSIHQTTYHKVTQLQSIYQTTYHKEEGVPDGPLAGSDREELDRLNSEYNELVREVGDKINYQVLRFAVPMRSRRAVEVNSRVRQLYLQIRAEGLPVVRCHSDRARELCNGKLSAWLLERGMRCIVSDYKLLVYGRAGKYDIDNKWRQAVCVGQCRSSEDVAHGHVVKFADGTFVTSLHLKANLVDPDEMVDLEVELPLPERRLKRKTRLAAIMADHPLTVVEVFEALKNVRVKSKKGRAGCGEGLSWTTGMFVHGGVAGLRGNTTRMRWTTRYLVEAAKRFKEGRDFSAVGTLENVDMRCHKDSHNDVATENVVVLIRKPDSGGELWVENEDLDAREAEWKQVTKKVAKKGRLHELEVGDPFESNPRKWHAVEPWQGTRTVLILHSPRATHLHCKDRDTLEFAGFPIGKAQWSGEEAAFNEPATTGLSPQQVELHLLQPLPTDGQDTFEDSMLTLTEDQEQLIEDLEERSARLRLLLEEEEALAEECRRAGQQTVDEVENVRAIIEEMISDLAVFRRKLHDDQKQRCLRAAAVAQEVVDYERLLGELKGDLEVVHTVPLDQVRAALPKWHQAMAKEVNQLLDGTLRPMTLAMARDLERLALTIAGARSWTGATSDIVAAFHLGITGYLEQVQIDEIGFGKDSMEDKVRAQGSLLALVITYVDDLLYLAEKSLVEAIHEWIQKDYVFEISHEGYIRENGCMMENLTLILAYLKTTQALKLVMGSDGVGKEGPMELVGFSDASFSPHGEKSYGASVVTVRDAPVAWKASKQSFVTLSVMEAELYETANAVVLLESVGSLLDEILGYQAIRRLKVDNSSALSMVQGGPGSWRTRHLKVRSAKIRSLVETGELLVEHTTGDLQLADLATKMQTKMRLWELLTLWGFKDLPQEAVQGLNTKSAYMAMLVLALMISPARADDGTTPARTGLQAVGVDELMLVTLLVCIAAVAIWEAMKGATKFATGWLRESPKQKRLRKLRDAAKAAAEEEVDRAFINRQVLAEEGAAASVAPIPTRAAPAGSADDVVIEDVTALLAQVTQQSEDEVKRAGVIETLRACNTVGLLKGQPILQRLFLDMYDETKRNRLMTSSRDSSTVGKPPVVADAVASGADRPSQEVSPEEVDVEMVESMDLAAGGDFAMADVPPGEGSAAPSITVPSTSGDYAWVEHEDVEQLQAWIQEQLDEAKDPQAVLPLMELPWVSVIDLFSKSHPWWEAVCRWYCTVPEEVGMIKGQKITSTVLARWNCLRREDHVKLLSHVDATSKEFHQEELLGTDRAVVQCVDAKKAVYRLVSPDVLPERLFRSEVATILRSLPKLVVEKMVAGAESENAGLLEDAILNVGGHLRSRMATLRQQEILKKQGQGFGTATVPRVRCFLCSKTVLPVREANASIEAPAPDGSSWRLVEGAWKNTSDSFREDFKYKFGRCRWPGGGTYSSEDLAQQMSDQAAQGLLFASDLDCPRFDSQDGPEQKPHECGVVFSPDMANARITLEDAAHQSEGAATFAEAVDLENKTHRGKVLKAAAGVAFAVLQCHSKLVAWASANEVAFVAFKAQGADILTCCEREYADVPTVRTVLTKLGVAICNLRTPNQNGATLLDLVSKAHAAGNLQDFGQQGWVEAKAGGIFVISYLDGADGWTPKPERAPTDRDIAMENLKALEQAAMEEGKVEEVAKKEMTFDKEEKAKREENKKRNAEQLQEHFVYTPVVQPPNLWSKELVELVERHAEGVTGELSSFQERDLNVLGRIQYEVVAVHKLIQSILNTPEDIEGGDLKHQADVQRVAAFFNPALFDKPFPELQGTKAPETLEDKVRTLDAMLQMRKKQSYLTGWRWDIWNMVGPTKNLGQKKFQKGFPLVHSNLRKRGEYRAARLRDHPPPDELRGPLDSKDRLRLRAEYDHRVTLPIESLPIDLKSFFSGKHKWAVAFQYYRCTGGAWLKAPNFVDKPNQRHWIHMECGMALTGFDYTRVGSSKRTKNRYACTLCRTEWGRDSVDGKWLKGEVVLQAIVTSPPQAERERWIQGRMLFCRKFKGTGPLLDAAPHKMPGKNPYRIRLSPKASTQLWRLVFSEPSFQSWTSWLTRSRENWSRMRCRFPFLNLNIEGDRKGYLGTIPAKARDLLLEGSGRPVPDQVDWSFLLTLSFETHQNNAGLGLGTRSSAGDEVAYGKVTPPFFSVIPAHGVERWPRVGVTGARTRAPSRHFAWDVTGNGMAAAHTAKDASEEIDLVDPTPVPLLLLRTWRSSPWTWRMTAGARGTLRDATVCDAALQGGLLGGNPRMGQNQTRRPRQFPSGALWWLCLVSSLGALLLVTPGRSNRPSRGLEVTLKDMGLGPHPVECDVAAKALLDPDVVAGVKATWLQTLLEDRSQKLVENFPDAVTRLQLAAAGCPSWTSLSPVGQLLADKAFGRALPMERLSGKRSWEHWAPRPSLMEGPVKQLALDRAAKKKWADKIISVLAPYHRHLDNMQDIKPGEDKYEVWRPLVGKARVNSLKSVFYSLKKLRSTLGCSPLPFSEEMAKHLLKQFTIYRLGQLWRTLHWGLLVSSEAKKERRATPPSMEVVTALEKLAGTLPEGSPDGYAASFFRFCIGASARFSDTVHTRPDTMKLTKDTLEFTAWQTKVKEVGDNDRPQPLIAPLVSFSRVEWWGPMIAFSKRRNRLATKGLEDDYLLPVPDRDRLDFTRAPCDNSRALRWLRALLSMKGAVIAEEEVKMMTLSSFRVFMPNLAFQMGVPREQRRYLGRWQGDSMADVYTREHRSVVLSIWKEVLSKPQPNAEDGVQFVPEDLDAPYYKLSEEPLMEAVAAQLPLLTSAKDPPEEKRADGPAFMATNSRKTGSPPVYRVHWFDRGYRCLGCGWRPKDSKSLVTFYELDWTPDHVFCAKAARAKRPPDCFLLDDVTKDSSSRDRSGSANSLESDSCSSPGEEAPPRMGASSAGSSSTGSPSTVPFVVVPTP